MQQPLLIHSPTFAVWNAYISTHTFYPYMIHTEGQREFFVLLPYFLPIWKSPYSHMPFSLLGWLPICNNSVLSCCLEMMDTDHVPTELFYDVNSKRSTHTYTKIYLKLLLVCISLELLTQALLLHGINLSLVVIPYTTEKVLITQMISSMSLEHVQKITHVNKITLPKVRKW